MTLDRIAIMAPGLGRTLAAQLIMCLALVLASLSPARAQVFPILTGRIVDQVGVLSTPTRASIEAKLRDLEAQSGIQIAVAVVPNLGGLEIEPYANRLFREWGLGQKDKNNGVLLLAATGERKIRIEVGYGLEGTLTDAVSKLIIVNAIAPSLRAGDFGTGLSKGVDDIIAVLSSDQTEWRKRPYAPRTDWPLIIVVIGVAILAGAFALIAVLLARNAKGKWVRTGPGQYTYSSDPSGTIAGSTASSGSESGSSGGSFSGDGGSSGGGGASGDF